MLNERIKWSFIGVLLGLGSPLGWLIIRFYVSLHPGSFYEWALYEVAEQNVLYLYETLGTVLSFGLFGYVAGALLEKVKHKSQQLEAKTLDYMKIVEFVAHELRTPLTSVKGRIDLALHETYGPMSIELQEALNKAVRGCEQINQMISSYLNLARIERGELLVKKGPVDLMEDVFMPLADELKGLFESRNMPIRFSGFEDDVPLVWGDPQWLKSAFRNLLMNAVRYGYENTAVTITLKSNAVFWLIEIYNEGIGVPADYLEKIFLKFEKVPRKGKAGEVGTGLGLYIVREIIHQHGGRIFCESLLNQWARMNVLLPQFEPGTSETKND